MSELLDIPALMELCGKATPGPWRATLCGEAGVYTGLEVKSHGCIKYKARVLAPGADESDLDDLREEIDEGTIDPAHLSESERALLQLEDNLIFSAAARTALPLALERIASLERELAELRARPSVQVKTLQEIRVAAAVIEHNGMVRIFRRGGNDSYTGKWEFPGGKANPGEELREALLRELKEELAVDSVIGRTLDHYRYQYQKRGPIDLTFFEVRLIGEPTLLEHTAEAWVHPSELPAYDLMNADMQFVATRYALTAQVKALEADRAADYPNVARDSYIVSKNG